MEDHCSLKIISSFKKNSRLRGGVDGRPSNGFVFKIRGYNKYFFENSELILNADEVIFLKKGSSYRYVSNKEGENLYTSINFDGDIDLPSGAVFSLKDFYKKDFIYTSFSELWKFGNSADKFECISVFYDFLSFISRIDNTEEKMKKKLDLLEPAVSFINKNIYDSELKVDSLHCLCGISDTYFRKIFRLKFNMTPKEYLLTMRLSHAKSIIESGDYDSISEVAMSVGYTDPLYFSKAFKKAYGISPSEIYK